MKPRISLITLGVSDLDRSLRFYRDGLGLPLRPESVDGEVAFFDMAGCWLALWGREALAADAAVGGAGSGFRAFALAHNVSAKEEVGAVLEEARRAGGEIVRPAADTFYGGYAGYFTDPEGHLWEVAWNPAIPELAA